MRRFLHRLKFLFKFHRSIPFLKDFFVSKEVKQTTKLLFVILLVAYIIIPFDLIPDFLVFFGIVDDITIALFLLQQMVKVAPPSLKEKHRLLS
ncbi:YkvA family protein [Oceanobacillus halophilus]|uniref:DUF1232 domain-containing protein n=1 Tax=Oceanobacillus halophilus TaxID=930130 RepID=A0A494ZWN7_9BACI|nr:DUF1232 domain-containing protein [Oceanobacillus halophilus]RKQ30900.1 DUF1232 domain-containing protein [Oceanobacillus halophilus]